MNEDLTMKGVTDETVTLQVSAGQFDQLSKDQVLPDRPRVTHNICVGPFYLPGRWVVVGSLERREPPRDTHWITLAKLED